MKNLVAILTVFLALTSGRLALAQSSGDLGNILNDALGGLLSGRPGPESRSWRGHLVQAKGTTMIFRSEDGKVYAVDMSAINTEAWHPMALGQALTLAAKPGPGAQTLIAARIEPEQPDRAGQLREQRAFRTVHGTVERVEGSQVTVRSVDGTVLPVDVARMTGEAELRANDGAAVILEPGPGNTVVWIEREDRKAGGGGGLLSGLPGEYQRLHGARVHASGATMIVRADDGQIYTVDSRVAGPGEYQRIHGYVQSVGGSTMSLKADDGRTLTVDTSQVEAQVRSAVRPGDLVSVVGKTAARADQFVAEVVEREKGR